ncbi:type II toxin-antitoxin system RelE/ParE family toxin [Paenibacillus sp. PAMC21692]|uniref:type II toxin-antitoxin system RelE/ParE family toxin n=1 Tax=Paenibacillus sp. PAMC21692 TaxID=2762320 RepID=UPI00164E52DD|nr:type II toxin-antitoxin system RelE/ParE family toxin [Paenibacillus sp. PAMC21692]QNK60820.1 type II toxin-antitoxin system RelE/ParE family toxin [Paenibacillus sp. PAMC21692]
MSYLVVITETAERDLSDIVNYIANDLLEPVTARRMVAKIAESVFQLEIIPFRFGLVEDERLAGQGIRKMLVDSYIVFFVVSEPEETVTVIRILYGRRHWNSLL